MSKDGGSAEGAGQGQPEGGPKKDPNADLFEGKGSKKLIRLVTVVAYMFSVSFVAIVLSAYYLFLWEPPNPKNLRKPVFLSGEPDAQFLIDDSPSLGPHTPEDALITVKFADRSVTELTDEKGPIAKRHGVLRETLDSLKQTLAEYVRNEKRDHRYNSSVYTLRGRPKPDVERDKQSVNWLQRGKDNRGSTEGYSNENATEVSPSSTVGEFVNTTNGEPNYSEFNQTTNDENAIGKDQDHVPAILQKWMETVKKSGTDLSKTAKNGNGSIVAAKEADVPPAGNRSPMNSSLRDRLVSFRASTTVAMNFKDAQMEKVTDRSVLEEKQTESTTPTTVITTSRKDLLTILTRSTTMSPRILTPTSVSSEPSTNGSYFVTTSPESA